MIDPCRIRTSTDINTIDEFIIEDVGREVHRLNGGFIKKFTSLATTSTIFRWQFGDTQQNPIIETTDNPYYHTFKEAGTYIISHQSCYPCNNQLVCSNGWCTQSITIVPPGKDWASLALGGMFGFLMLKGEECEEQKTKEMCHKLKQCRWLEKESQCVEKCKEGYKLEKESTEDVKRPFKFKCAHTREQSEGRSKLSKEKK